MNITYKSSDWVFDREKFAEDVKAARAGYGLSHAELDELLGFKRETNVVEGGRKGWHPLVGTLLAYCNTLDLNPADYWCLEAIEAQK